jgi:exodeoxyribonuclease V alpha subunit
MTEATGVPATTIAGFLHNTRHEDLAGCTHLVIDEASMLDLVNAVHIFRRVPDHVDVILVGDAS